MDTIFDHNTQHKSVLTALQKWAAQYPTKLAVIGKPNSSLTFSELWQAVQHAKHALIALQAERIALKADNSINWAIIDLAAIAANIVLVPVPVFFSTSQVTHLLDAANVDTLIGNWEETTDTVGYIAALPVYHRATHNKQQQLPAGTAKVTFTSGSTGQPKGVCLSMAHLDNVAQTLANELLFSSCPNKHFVLLPLSTLLENIAGLYVPIMLGISTTIISGRHLGLTGSSQFNPSLFIHALQSHKPQSLVLTPQLLMALTDIVQAAPEAVSHTIRSLKFVAVGGARVSPQLLSKAHAAGIPAYEGYGLSECGSVVSLNRPDKAHPQRSNLQGSSGRILPHCHVTFSEDGEVLVSGSTMLGYIGASTQPTLIATGDLGYLDEDGFLHITGRKKNVLITSYGRNISPEWIESEAQAYAGLQQMVVLGDGQASLTAIIASHASDHPSAQQNRKQNLKQIAESITQLNASLPDYARIGSIIVSRPFNQLPELITSNGRPRRDAFLHYFQAELNKLDSTISDNVTTPAVTKCTESIDTEIIILNTVSTISIPKENTMTTVMPFFEQLQQHTKDAQQTMRNAPVFAACANGEMSLDAYISFLTQAYHHVKHTVPLLMACGSRLPEHYEWLRQAIGEYIEEEKGHHEWILNDIQTCGGNTKDVRANTHQGKVGADIELMVAYLYHQIDRRNPMAFFGMVWVLEGTSVSEGGQVAAAIQTTLTLPDSAMTYLKSHSELDQEHIKMFEGLMNQITDPDDQQAIIDGANIVYQLYGQMLHNLPITQSHSTSTAAT
ncbi:long-chain fatty acid--CoA ligase [Photobacterium frigidiphilum]|uniref:Long-chain fatty acid--CoA ligase n=2 Tax=Photobacterium frigidiphilum TaxID=264736 RepID=A0A2T3JMD5_9GAMM|nr:long-chain fatty acid--CoA ligase [Photobacterium frigidiphilum]